MHPETHKWGLAPWRLDVKVPLAPLPDEVDVAVVGAGLTGLSAAYHLRLADARRTVAVLDYGRVGDGASGRSGGLFLEDTAAGRLPEFENCVASAAELFEREQIDCALIRNGCWEISHKRAMPESPIEWSDDGGTLRCSDLVEGGSVDPGRMTAGLAHAAMRAGASIHENCLVEEMAFEEPVRVVTSNGTVRAKRVVLATNGYSFHLSAMKRRATAFLAIGVATAPLSDDAVRQLGLHQRRPFYTDDLPYLWGRVAEDNRLVAGSGLLPFEPHVAVRTTGAQILYRGLERRIRGLHPVLKEVEFTHQWMGPICITSDQRPVLARHPDSPHVWIAAGYSGHGLAQSIRMGKLVAEKIDRD